MHSAARPPAAGLVKIVPKLPAWLQGPASFGYDETYVSPLRWGGRDDLAMGAHASWAASMAQCRRDAGLQSCSWSEASMHACTACVPVAERYWERPEPLYSSGLHAAPAVPAAPAAPRWWTPPSRAACRAMHSCCGARTCCACAAPGTRCTGTQRCGGSWFPGTWQIVQSSCQSGRVLLKEDEKGVKGLIRVCAPVQAGWLQPRQGVCWRSALCAGWLVHLALSSLALGLLLAWAPNSGPAIACASQPSLPLCIQPAQLPVLPPVLQSLGQLRAAIHSALWPSRQVLAGFESRLEALASAMGLPVPLEPAAAARAVAGPETGPPLPYLAVHLRDEPDWERACKQDAGNPRQTQVGGVRGGWQ